MVVTSGANDPTPVDDTYSDTLCCTCNTNIISIKFEEIVGMAVAKSIKSSRDGKLILGDIRYY